MLQPSVLSHERSPVIYAGALLLSAALLTLAPRLGSMPVALGAGVASGGARAIFVCGLVWHTGVPNPLKRGNVAFSLADVAIAMGVASLLGGALLYGWRNRAHLHEPIQQGARRAQPWVLSSERLSVTVCIITRIQTGDYERWRPMFDQDKPRAREKAIVERVLRNDDDGNEVFIYLEFADLDDAKEARDRLVASGVLDRFAETYGPSVLVDAG